MALSQRDTTALRSGSPAGGQYTTESASDGAPLQAHPGGDSSLLGSPAIQVLANLSNVQPPHGLTKAAAAQYTNTDLTAGQENRDAAELNHEL